MLRIHRDFPEAHFVHIIRDARDVALSLDKRQWSRPFHGTRSAACSQAGIYWEWIVRKGRAYATVLGPKYMEVHYEALVEQPEPTLKRIGEFLGHDPDYKIRERSVGSVKKPRTSFNEDLQEGRFTPVRRWKDKFPEDQLLWFERLVGDYLQELAYPLAHPLDGAEHDFAVRRMR